MKLLREWNGVTHEVSVLEDGFEYRGERYKSLSAIARAITGARWGACLPCFRVGTANDGRRHGPGNL